MQLIKEHIRDVKKRFTILNLHDLFIYFEAVVALLAEHSVPDWRARLTPSCTLMTPGACKSRLGCSVL